MILLGGDIFRIQKGTFLLLSERIVILFARMLFIYRNDISRIRIGTFLLFSERIIMLGFIRVFFFKRRYVFR